MNLRCIRSDDIRATSSRTDEAVTTQTANQTANRLSGVLARIRRGKSDSRGRRAMEKSVVKEHRIQVRWHHFGKTMGNYLAVRPKNGGGNRFMACLSSDPPPLLDLLQKASELYFRMDKIDSQASLANFMRVCYQRVKLFDFY